MRRAHARRSARWAVSYPRASGEGRACSGQRPPVVSRGQPGAGQTRAGGTGPPPPSRGSPGAACSPRDTPCRSSGRRSVPSARRDPAPAPPLLGEPGLVRPVVVAAQGDGPGPAGPLVGGPCGAGVAPHARLRPAPSPQVVCQVVAGRAGPGGVRVAWAVGRGGHAKAPATGSSRGWMRRHVCRARISCYTTAPSPVTSWPTACRPCRPSRRARSPSGARRSSGTEPRGPCPAAPSRTGAPTPAPSRPGCPASSPHAPG